jgi:hypothetical protein
LKLLLFDVVFLGFLGELFLVVRLSAELDLAVGILLENLIKQVAQLALPAAEGQQLGLILLRLGVDLLGRVVDRFLQ